LPEFLKFRVSGPLISRPGGGIRGSGPDFGGLGPGGPPRRRRHGRISAPARPGGGGVALRMRFRRPGGPGCVVSAARHGGFLPVGGIFGEFGGLCGVIRARGGPCVADFGDFGGFRAGFRGDFRGKLRPSAAGRGMAVFGFRRPTQRCPIYGGVL